MDEYILYLEHFVCLLVCILFLLFSIPLNISLILNTYIHLVECQGEYRPKPGVLSYFLRLYIFDCIRVLFLCIIHMLFLVFVIVVVSYCCSIFCRNLCCYFFLFCAVDVVVHCGCYRCAMQIIHGTISTDIQHSFAYNTNATQHVCI
jgi:hypothetical protein